MGPDHLLVAFNLRYGHDGEDRNVKSFHNTNFKRKIVFTPRGGTRYLYQRHLTQEIQGAEAKGNIKEEWHKAIYKEANEVMGKAPVNKKRLKIWNEKIANV